MQRQLLDPIGDQSAPAVVRRLCGVQAQVASSAELAVSMRRRSSRPVDVARALSQGRLIKTWAMRGTLHLLTPDVAATFLPLLAAGRIWERPSWQRYYGLTPKQMDALHRAIRDELEGAVLTREELAAAVSRRRGLRHVGEALASGWGTLLKPAAWHGDLCFGPSRASRVTFMRPADASARWNGVLDPEAAAAVAIPAYLRAYAPAPRSAFGNWLAGGWVGRRSLTDAFVALGDRLAEVDVEGTRAFVLAEDVDELVSVRPTRAVRLLPGFDQYVLGPGTGDGNVVPAPRRRQVSRQSGWIAPVVVAGGVVCGVWKLDGDIVRVEWFGEAGRPPRRALTAEIDRLSAILQGALSAAIEVV
jgi:Winged helix DNA-binding domain